MTLKDLFDSLYAREDMNKELAQQDFNIAQSDCKVGVYNKWYWSNRKDDGLAYDLGWMHANETVKNDSVHFI